MPFTIVQKHRFNDSVITNDAPQKGKGVYGLYDDQGWLAVDEYTNNLEATLRDILNNNAFSRSPKYFEFEQCNEDVERASRLAELQTEYLHK